jgi:hypothetical protein
MSSRGRSRFGAWVFSCAVIAGVSACGEDDSDGGDGDAGTGGTLVAGATASGGGAGRGGTSSSGGTSGSGSGLTTGRGGSGDAAGDAGKAGRPTAGSTAANAGRAGSMNGSAGEREPPGGDTGDSPYEIECHGDTVMCGDPTALLCLGLRVGTEVFGYSCSNDCASDADCSDLPASADASAGCVDFVDKKYCLLVCKNGDEQASCPSGMYCYVYEGSPIGYCLWR